MVSLKKKMEHIIHEKKEVLNQSNKKSWWDETNSD